MVPKIEPKSKFGKWLLKYRLKIILFSFIVVIPVVFVVALYVGDYLRHSSVDFEGKKISNFKTSYMTVESETNHQIINLETNEVIVQIKLIDYLIPEYYDDTNGHYTFKVKYEVKSGSHIHAVSAKFILQTDWINARSNVINVPMTETFGTNRRISFNHVLPQAPLWFVDVKAPYLYVELEYHVDLALGQEETVVHYFKTYLGNITPTNVTDAENNS
jgi:hypothetical protein